jgi:uncharacterized protein (TIGR02118 family)
MIKVIATLKRRPGLTPDEFERYYFERHAQLASEVIPPEIAGEIRYYVHNYAVRFGDGGSDAPYDCVAEIGFDDLEAMERWNAWYRSADGKVLRDDEDNFMDRSRRVVVVTRERVPPRAGAG